MNKINPKFQSINEYILTFKPEVREILEEVRNVIKKASPDAIETIAYQMPTFKLDGKNLVHFAGYKKHIGFYPTPSGVSEFENEIAKYVHAKGSVQFPIDEPIPYKLIEKIVKFRVSEVINK